MCGIAGIVDIGRPIDRAIVEKMAASIRHRGPDGTGFYFDDGIGLAATRLAIIDIPGGAQPMTSADGRYTIAYNGEIYNHAGLKKNLESCGHVFRTRCDTEVALHAVAQWGLEAPEKLRGIFAYAVWDALEKKLILARDRIGVKPLYRFFGEGWMAFASEVKALLCIPQVAQNVRADIFSINEIIKFNFPCGDRTAFDGIREVEPGFSMWWKGGRYGLKRYWDLNIPPADKKPAPENAEDASREVHDKLREAVRIRMMSDVPLGAFLSGGIDSSFVTALAQAESKTPISSFSIGFDEEAWDETQFAIAAASHIGSRHTCVMNEAGLESLPEVIYHLDQPQRWAGTVSLLQLYKRVKRDVTVVLTGEGSDEILAGYPHLAAFTQIVESYKNKPVAPGAANALSYWQCLSETDISLTKYLYSDDFLASLQSGWSGYIADEEKVAGRFPLDVATFYEFKNRLPKFVTFMQDRLSMAAGVEARVPFLDHEFVELAAKIHPDLKLRPPWGKYILRTAAQNILPESILRRAKQGFVEPAGAWMRGKLPECIADALSQAVVKKYGYFKPEAVAALLKRHRETTADFGHLLIGIASVHIWHDIFLTGGAPEKPKTPNAK